MSNHNSFACVICTSRNIHCCACTELFWIFKFAAKNGTIFSFNLSVLFTEHANDYISHSFVCFFLLVCQRGITLSIWWTRNDFMAKYAYQNYKYKVYICNVCPFIGLLICIIKRCKSFAPWCQITAHSIYPIWKIKKNNQLEHYHNFKRNCFILYEEIIYINCIFQTV